MYAGTTLTAASGRILGGHQTIDRKARRQLQVLLGTAGTFPTIRQILHFEGRNGPDAIKRKSPAKDEPMHFFSPFDETDTLLVELVESHYAKLVAALRSDDQVVAAFEAAWLAHAMVDGLTPAHHYPYEEKLVELRGGLGPETRASIKDKVILPGDTRAQLISNNWKMWGPKGLFTTHYAFEWGVSTILLTTAASKAAEPSAAETEFILGADIGPYFRQTAKEIAAYGLYDTFYNTGWTVALARKIRRQLIPTIIRTVTLVWYKAACEAHAGVNNLGSA